MSLKFGQVFQFSIICLAMFSCSDPQEKCNFTIDGKVIGADNGRLYFMHQNPDGNPQVDTVDFENGSFVYKGYVQEPTPFYLSSSLLRNNNEPPVLLFIEPAKMKMTLGIDNLDAATLSNSKSNQEYISYKNADKVYKQKADSIYTLAMKHKDDPAMQKRLESEMYTIDSLESELISTFVSNNKHSVVSAYLISGKFLSRGDFARAQSLFSILDKDVQNSHIGTQVGEVLAKAAMTEPGSEAPDFVQKDVEGNQVALKDFRGKYVLIDFWASWCSPCRQENPFVTKVYSKYKNDNFEIIGISLDKDKTQWIKAIKEDNLTWPQLSDLNGWNNEVSKTYGVQSIPENFLLDPQGKILAKNLRGEELGAKLAEIFGH